MIRQDWDDQQDSLASVLNQAKPESIDDVLAKQAALQTVLNRLQGNPDNPVASFNILYWQITTEIRNEVPNFKDPEFLPLLDVKFADLYLDALIRWTHRTPDVPQCWSLLFERWDDADVPPVIGSLAGVAAHVISDLPRAVFETFQFLGSSFSEGSPQHSDYLVINDIFQRQIPILHRQLTMNNELAAAVDLANWIFDDVVASRILVALRDTSWTASQELWTYRNNAEGFREISDELDERAAELIRGLFGGFANPLGAWLLGPRPLLF